MVILAGRENCNHAVADYCAEAVPDQACAAVEREIQTLCQATGLMTPALVFEPWVNDTPGIKRRRIRCQIKPQAERRVK